MKKIGVNKETIDKTNMQERKTKKSDKNDKAVFEGLLTKKGANKESNDTANVHEKRNKQSGSQNDDKSYSKNLMNFVEEDRKKSKKFTDILFSRQNSRDKNDNQKTGDSPDKPAFFSKFISRN